MALDCGLITDGIVADCAKIPSSTLDETLYVLNFSELDRNASTTDATGMITSLQLKTQGQKIYKFDGGNGTLQPNVTEVTEGIFPSWTHALAFNPLVITQENRNLLEQLSKGRFIAIIDRIGNQFHEVFGFDTGMRLLETEWNFAEQASGGVPVATLRNLEEQTQEPKLPRIWQETDYQTTATRLAALVSTGQPAPVVTGASAAKRK